jgi:uncharacterized protein YfbU (UPF0304 family)
MEGKFGFTGIQAGANMELSKKERLAFIYQLRILEALYPNEAANFANHRTALENGYALHYDWIIDHLSNEMSEEECREVLDILDMYRAITFGLKKLDEGDTLQEHSLAKFSGFDGNNETEQMGYARYFIVDLDRYSELKQGEYNYFNSHTPMLDTYRKMLEQWRRVDNRFDLSREQIAAIFGAE